MIRRQYHFVAWKLTTKTQLRDSTPPKRDRTKPSNSSTEQAAIDEKLWKAAKEGQLIRVRRLLEQGAEIHSRFKGLGGKSYAVSALDEAAAGGFTDMVKELITESADLNQLTMNHPTHDDTPLFGAASCGHDEFVAALVEAGADVEICRATGETALYRVPKLGHATVVKALIKAPIKRALR